MVFKTFVTSKFSSELFCVSICEWEGTRNLRSFKHSILDLSEVYLYCPTYDFESILSQWVIIYPNTSVTWAKRQILLLFSHGREIDHVPSLGILRISEYKIFLYHKGCS